MNSVNIIDKLDECVVNVEGIGGIIDMIGSANDAIQPRNQECICAVLFKVLIDVKRELEQASMLLEEIK